MDQRHIGTYPSAQVRAQRHNVLMIYNYLPPVEGGIEAHVGYLFKHLEHVNISYLGLKKAKDSPLKEVGKDVKVHLIRPFPILLSIIFRFILGLRIILVEKIDLIHAHTISTPGILGICLGLLLRKPVVLTVHSSVFIQNISSRKLISIILYRFLIKYAKFIITPSDELRLYVLSLDKKARVAEIPNGVDMNIFNPTIKDDSIRLKYKLLGVKIVLCPRRIVEKNGIIYLIESIPEIIKSKDDVCFLIVGPNQDKKYYEFIKKRVEELNIQDYIIFTGSVPHTDMPKYYSTSDIVVIPSLIEAISLSALEAMASKKPIVATTVGGLLEIFTEKNNNGLLVKPADSKELADGILFLLNNDILASKYAENAYETAKRYSWNNVAERTLHIYHTLLNQ